MAIWEDDRAVQVLPSGCIIWTGAKHGGGYSSVQVDGVQRAAHRVAYEQAYGPIPDGMHVCHRCDVRSCINPDHLFAGTHADNMADKARKGRVVPMIGERSGTTKLKDADVIAMRAMNAAGASMIEIGKAFKVSDTCAYSICRGRTWRHLLSKADEVTA